MAGLPGIIGLLRARVSAIAMQLQLVKIRGLSIWFLVWAPHFT